MLLGVVADDLTGATDVALMLQREGMSAIQTIGVPPAGEVMPAADAVVVALKSRTTAVEEAVEQSLASARALRDAGARQILFKYCSTFDSTDRGNIGPVAEALARDLQAQSVVFCPAFPANGRAVFQGHLFVGQALLSDSPMRDHPLTPMRDANLVRVLGRQSSTPVGLVPWERVVQGPDAIARAIADEAAAGRAFVIADAVSDANLRDLARAVADAPFVTGGAGIAMGLPRNFGFEPGAAARIGRPQAPPGRSVILSGSCSAATRRQVAAFRQAGLPAYRVDALQMRSVSDGAAIEAALGWYEGQDPSRPALFYATAEPLEVAAVQSALGVEQAGTRVEALLAGIAAEAVARGATCLIVAGGETSGAVVAALGVRALSIGPEIAPGVPWTQTLGDPPLALALKSGNFGADDIFLKAWELIQ